MSTKRLLIVGAGGHAKVVIDSVLQAPSKPEHVVVLDDNINFGNDLFMGQMVKGPVVEFLQSGDFFHVAIGDNQDRERMYQLCVSLGCLPYPVVHSGSIQAISATMAAGVFVAAKAIIGPDASINEGVIVNHGAVVDHDCDVGCFAHIAPNATLGGGVKIGRRSLIGAGANILPGVVVADDVIVGAGAVVNKSVPQYTVVIGNPAKKLREIKQD